MENHSTAYTLADLTVGSIGQVVSVELNGLLRRRILDLGLVPGTPVQCIRKSPAGNPVAYRIRGTLIALRSDDARLIKVYARGN
ncbi:MAG: ferrous iron transport protein A [Syntrophomonadaceae bacterium]|nr:ferrous iron transport protein A [Syntrophomonadaceae bacterium]